jgi:hypothetical protein
MHPHCILSLLSLPLIIFVRTVWETFEFAWLVSSNGHHSYAMTADEASVKELDKLDPVRSKVRMVHIFRSFISVLFCRSTISFRFLA